MNILGSRKIISWTVRIGIKIARLEAY